MCCFQMGIHTRLLTAEGSLTFSLISSTQLLTGGKKAIDLSGQQPTI